MVGLLAALGVVLSSILAFVHGDLTPLVVLGSGTATGLAAYLALPPSKKITHSHTDVATITTLRL
jgi:hypothetical protein